MGHNSQIHIMAIGKNKRLSKGGKKKGGRRAVDQFAKKEWYDIKAPAMFTKRHVGKTLINKTIGTKIASDLIKGRVFEVNLADLQGRNLLTNFHGLSFTSDKIKSLTRKWHSLIEATVDARTSDGYLMRLFAIGVTARRQRQTRKTSYAQASQVRAIREKMVDIMRKETQNVDLKGFVSKLIPKVMKKEIETAARSIYPLQNVFVHKVKVIRKPRFDVSKLLDIHSGATAAASQKIIRKAEAKNKPSQE